MTARKPRNPSTKDTGAQIEKRKRIWRHNSFIGHATMMQRQTQAIAAADSTSYIAKALAQRIETLSEQLAKELRTRVDLPLPAT